MVLPLQAEMGDIDSRESDTISDIVVIVNRSLLCTVAPDPRTEFQKSHAAFSERDLDLWSSLRHAAKIARCLESVLWVLSRNTEVPMSRILLAPFQLRPIQ